jgi:hypothetical protein
LDFVVAGADPLGQGYTSPYKMRIFRNEGTQFVDVADALVGFDVLIESLTPTWVDYDNDGDPDLWIPAIRSDLPSLLFRNDGTRC